MSLYPTSGFRNLLIEVPHLAHPKRNKKSDKSNLNWQYQPTYSLDSSWVHGAPQRTVDPLQDSMLAYSKRMSDIKRIRGVHIFKPNPNNSQDHPLWINVTGLNQKPERSYGEPRRAVKSNRVPPPRSLGAIKLEPLLGSYQGEKAASSPIKPEVQNPLSKSERENDTVSPKQIRLSIDLPTVENDSDMEPDEEPHPPTPEVPAKNLKPAEEKLEPVKESEPARHLILPPIITGGKRPRRAKRMKITAPQLESINEITVSSRPPTPIAQLRAPQLQFQIPAVSIGKEYDQEEMITRMRATLLNLVKHEEKRVKEKMILKAAYRYRKSDAETRQSKMTSLAQRKIQKLPPLPVPAKSVTLKYTNRSSLE